MTRLTFSENFVSSSQHGLSKEDCHLRLIEEKFLFRPGNDSFGEFQPRQCLVDIKTSSNEETFDEYYSLDLIIRFLFKKNLLSEVQSIQDVLDVLGMLCQDVKKTARDTAREEHLQLQTVASELKALTRKLALLLKICDAMITSLSSNLAGDNNVRRTHRQPNDFSFCLILDPRIQMESRESRASVPHRFSFFDNCLKAARIVLGSRKYRSILISYYQNGRPAVCGV